MQSTGGDSVSEVFRHVFIISERGCLSAGERRMMGFDPLINQRLLPPTFPRYTAIRSREETVEYFCGLIQRLSQFAGIAPLSDNLHGLIVSSAFYHIGSALCCSVWHSA